MPSTEHTSPSSGPGPVSVPANARSANGGLQAEIDLDPATFDALSRSLTSGGGFLEPEPLENAMFRSGTPSRGTRAGDEEDAIDSDDDDNYKPTEHSPLLQRPRALSKAQSVASAATATIGPSFLIETHPTRFWLVFSQVLMAYFIACFDGTIMASSHPVITSYFHASNSASWLSTAFLLTSSAVQPLMGRLSDALGRKPLFVTSIAILTVATTWCGLANSIESFIMARAACGLGAGGISALGSIIVSDIVPIENRGTYQSYLNANYGAGAALGAALGGAMADYLGWRWEFGIQVPLLIVCIIISLVAIPDDLGIQGERKTVWQALKEFDAKGSLTLTTSMTLLILGLNLGGNVLPWSHPFVVASLSIFVVLFPTFIWIESKVHKPIMPLSVILQTPRANLIFSNFIASFLANAIIFNIPIYFQAVLLTSATSSGLRLVIPTIATSVAGTMVGFAINVTRRLKWPSLSGTILIFLGLMGLCCLQRGLPDILYLFILLPSSIGQGLQFPGTMMAILAVSAQREQAVVTSTLVLWRCLGQVSGVAASSLVLQNGLSYYLDLLVQGNERDEIIGRVRRSVEAIHKLEQPYLEQVVQSYEAALRLTFMMAAVMAFISVCLVLPMKLPRLGIRKVAAK